MNRDHQFTPGTESERAAYFCDRCGRSREAHGDSTPPATPVEPPVESAGLEVMRLGTAVYNGTATPAEAYAWLTHKYVCTDQMVRKAAAILAHPPAVSGEGERLKEQAAAYRAIALDALARWQGEDDHSDDNQRRNRSARSRATLRHRICAVDDTVRASTPTPGTPR